MPKETTKNYAEENNSKLFRRRKLKIMPKETTKNYAEGDN
jgi:hypothetical protein